MSMADGFAALKETLDHVSLTKEDIQGLKTMMIHTLADNPKDLVKVIFLLNYLNNYAVML